MSYDIYLGRDILPVTPSAMSLKISNKNKKITLINEGEVNLLKAAGLTEVSFDFLLPNSSYPFSKSGHGAEYFLNVLENLKTRRSGGRLQPFQFIVLRTKPDGGRLHNTNLKVSLEDYTVKESAKELFDLVVSIQLAQYRDYGTKTFTVSPENKVAPSTKRETSTAPVGGGQYTVKSGDNLWNIAKNYYGDGAQWPKIYEANKGAVGSNPNLIYPGQTFSIPK